MRPADETRSPGSRRSCFSPSALHTTNCPLTRSLRQAVARQVRTDSSPTAFWAVMRSMPARRPWKPAAGAASSVGVHGSQSLTFQFKAGPSATRVAADSSTARQAIGLFMSVLNSFSFVCFGSPLLKRIAGSIANPDHLRNASAPAVFHEKTIRRDSSPSRWVKTMWRASGGMSEPARSGHSTTRIAPSAR